MTRTTLALLVLLAPLSAYAQPRTDRPTSLNPPAGLGASQVTDYLGALRTATTNIEIETRGETRRMFNAHRIKITATWAKRPGSDGPVLQSATIEPVAGGRLKFGDEEINKLTINSKGEITIDRKGIDITIYKITRKANGDLVLDLPWYAFGDKTIKAKDVPFDIKGWPPELQDLVHALMNPKSGGATTRHEARIDWNLSGQADPHAFPFKGGSLSAASSFSLRGAGELRPDGTFRTIGDGNRVSLELRVGNGNSYSHGNGNLGFDVRPGSTARLEGRYGVFVPGGGRPFSMEVDGALSYSVDASKIVMNVPSGPRLRANSGHFDGNGRLVGSIGPGGATMVLRDGVYNLQLNGPMSVSGLSVGDFDVNDLQFDGSIKSSGRVEELSADRVSTTGSWEGNVRGLSARIAGQDGAGSLRVLPGSNLSFRADEGRIDAALAGSDNRNAGSTSVGLSAKGHLEGNLELGDVHADLGKVNADLRRVNLTLSADGDVGTGGDPNADVVRNLRGRIDAEVVGGGTLSLDGLPGAPVLPAGQRRHTVVAGDTLHRIARNYGVSVDQLKAANGIAADSTLINVGQELKIPGSANMRDALPTEAPGAATTKVADGTKAAIELENATVGRDGRVRAQGFVSGQVRVRDVDLRSSTLVAHVLGAAQATLPRTGFTYDSATGVQLAEVQVPVRIDLSKGSRLHTPTSAGREMDVVIDRDGSYAEFTVVVKRGADGKLFVPELQKIDLLLHSDGAAKFAGEVVDVAGKKSIRYTGRMAFLPNGIDFYGDVSVTVSGDANTPAVRIRW